MDNLKIFENEQFGQVRVVEKDGESWFVAKDVCDILKHSNSRKAVNDMVDKQDVTKGYVPHPQSETKQMKVTIVNEAGLYSLILRSNLPQAKQFKRWITHEVIPSIRKTGQYIANKDSYMIENPVERAQRWIEEELERQDLRLATQKQKQVIGELKPKADYTDKILKNKGLVTITQIAKDYGMSGREMNDLLHELCVQYKQSGQWLLYADYHSKGYTQSETFEITRTDGSPDVVMNTKWTQKGRLFLYNLLKENEVLPVIEQ